MTFADRMKKRPPLVLAAVDAAATAQPSSVLGARLCVPQALVVDGHHLAGVVGIEFAPLVVGGVGSIRILEALDELLSDTAGVPSRAELAEAASFIRKHLDSLSAAADQAHAEHEKKHQHGKDLHQ